MVELCKGGCGNRVLYSGWCGIKWKKENRICVNCPKIEKRRGKSISAYRLKEAKLGLNPMQNPEICKKNHSIERNKNASKTMKKLAEQGLLPQQVESDELRERRLRRIRKKLQKLAKEGKLPQQIESEQQKKARNRKISNTLKEKISKGIIKIAPAKKVSYDSLSNGKVNLRSYWEYEVAKFLDLNNFEWSYEPFPVPYWNSEKNEMRNTIPDFFLPKHNLMIEVKASKPYFFRNTEEKMKGVRDAGFNAIVWMDKEIALIRKEKHDILLRDVEKYRIRSNS